MYSICYDNDDDFYRETSCREILLDDLYGVIGKDRFDGITLYVYTNFPFSQQKLNKLADEFNIKSISIKDNYFVIKLKTTTLPEEVSLLLLLLRFKTELLDYELINYIIETNSSRISNDLIYSLFGYHLKLSGITVNNYFNTNSYYDEDLEEEVEEENGIDGIASSIYQNYSNYRKYFKDFYDKFPKLYNIWANSLGSSVSFKYFSSQFIGE